MAPLKEIFLFLIDPWLFMLQALAQLPGTILTLLLAGDFKTILSPRRLQSAWFGRFWAVAGPGVRDTGSARVIPLLEGRVHNGKIHPTSSPPSPPAPSIRGVVLELGPGTGLWAPVLAAPGADVIRRVYGVEPNAAVHDELRRRVAAAGLGDAYEVVPCGVEDLASSGRVHRESVDCIVSVLCLCSVPDPEATARELFGYLRPGGTWFVYEHVRSESERTRECGLGMRVYQGESVFVLWHCNHQGKKDSPDLVACCSQFPCSIIIISRLCRAMNAG